VLFAESQELLSLYQKLIDVVALINPGKPGKKYPKYPFEKQFIQVPLKIEKSNISQLLFFLFPISSLCKM
jgi:hypothetical protein